MARRKSTERMIAEGEAAPGKGHNQMDEAAERAHYEAIVAAQALVAEARGKEGAAWKAYEEAGGDRKALKFSMRLNKLSQHQQVEHMNNIVRIAKVLDLPIGSQLSLLEHAGLTDSADGDASIH